MDYSKTDTGFPTLQPDKPMPVSTILALTKCRFY